MSKGLSDLQKQILLLAYINGGTVFEHRGKRLSTSNVDLSTRDVLTEIFQSGTVQTLVRRLYLPQTPFVSLGRMANGVLNTQRGHPHGR